MYTIAHLRCCWKRGAIRIESKGSRRWNSICLALLNVVARDLLAAAAARLCARPGAYIDCTTLSLSCRHRRRPIMQRRAAGFLLLPNQAKNTAMLRFCARARLYIVYIQAARTMHGHPETENFQQQYRIIADGSPAAAADEIKYIPFPILSRIYIYLGIGTTRYELYILIYRYRLIIMPYSKEK